MSLLACACVCFLSRFFECSTHTLQEAEKSLDYIIDTVSAPHELEPLVHLLTVNGKLVIVGIPVKPFEMKANAVIFGKFLMFVQQGFLDKFAL